MRDFTDQMKLRIPVTKNGIPILTVILGIWHCHLEIPAFGLTGGNRPDQVNFFMFLLVTVKLCCYLLVKYLLPIKVNNESTTKNI